MFKKITAGVATLALSVGILSTASAAELTQPSSPIKNPIQVSSSNIIKPFAATLYVTRYDYFDKKNYPLSSETPAYFFTTEVSKVTGTRYGGNIPKIKVEPYGLDFWKVTYAGHLSALTD